MSESKPKLSAVLIAKNEELDLPEALQSLRGLADEIVVVVDPSSADKTAELAKRAGAKLGLRAFDTYAGQKQAALDLATGDWVLSIDADERVSPELREEILRVIGDSPGAAGFSIPFETYFLGRRLRFGGLGSEKHLRLFRRDKARFVGGALHEGVSVHGPAGRLRGTMLHVPYRDLDEYLTKMELYTNLAAKKRYEAGRRFHWWHHLLLPWEFFARAVLKLGILDGRPGVVWAGLSAFHSWLKYVKLGELERK